MKDTLSIVPRSFRVLEEVPAPLYTCEPSELLEVLSGPTIITMKGVREQPIFVSSLMHGNEHTGFLAMQKLLQEYKASGKPWPRSIYWLVGNVEAAAQNRRHLDHQPDFNRIWKGGDTPLAKDAVALAGLMKSAGLFANIDIHNNTGRNPQYACMSELAQDHKHLASLFGRTVVYFRAPDTAQSIVFSEFVPSVTIECGLSGNERGTIRAAEFVDAAMHLDHFPEQDHSEIDLFHTVIRIRIPEGKTFGFEGDEDADLILRDDIDDLNFRTLPIGSELGRCKDDFKFEIDATLDTTASADIFDYSDGKVTMAKEFTPSMFTRDRRVIRQDCLGYLMQKISF